MSASVLPTESELYLSLTVHRTDGTVCDTDGPEQ